MSDTADGTRRRGQVQFWLTKQQYERLAQRQNSDPFMHSLLSDLEGCYSQEEATEIMVSTIWHLSGALAGMQKVVQEIVSRSPLAPLIFPLDANKKAES